MGLEKWVVALLKMDGWIFGSVLFLRMVDLGNGIARCLCWFRWGLRC